MKTKKVFGVTLAVITITMLISALVIGCPDNTRSKDPGKDPVKEDEIFNVTLAKLENGSIIFSPSKGKEGDEIRVISVRGAARYIFSPGTLKYTRQKDSVQVPINETLKRFNMPADNVEISAEFEASVEPVSPQQELTQWDDELMEIIEGMSVEEKVGQMTQTTLQGMRASGYSAANVRTDMLGSMIANAGQYPTGTQGGDIPRGWVTMINTYQTEAMNTSLKIPLLWGIDAVHGHNSVTEATIFPHNSGLGAIAVADLDEGIEAVTTEGRITAEEMIATGIHWTFSPQVTVAHDVRWGRAYEAYGENVEIVTAMGRAAIESLQLNGVIATAKHYVGEGWNQYGLNGGWGYAGDANEPLTPAQLEDAIQPYRAAVDAGVMTVMPAKSYTNGIYLHKHQELLTDKLKGELGFEGFIISDWYHEGSSSDIRDAINAGVDMIMIGNQLNYRTLMAGVIGFANSGNIQEGRLNEAVLRILRVKKKIGLLEPEYTLPVATATGQVGTPENRGHARRIAAKALTLMKNETQTIQKLKDANNILITGQAADNMGMQCGGWTHGWQEGTDIPTVGTTVVAGIRNKIGTGRVTLSNAGNNNSATNTITGNYDAIIAVIGDGPHAEDDGDRGRSNNATIPLRVGGQAANTAAGNWNDVGMLNAIYDYKATPAGANVPLTVIMLTGRPMTINSNATPASRGPHYLLWDAFVVAWLPGSETGNAVADVLFGDLDFVGKSPFTWRTSYATVPGYRNAGTYPNPPASEIIYPYGHGKTKAGTN